MGYSRGQKGWGMVKVEEVEVRRGGMWLRLEEVEVGTGGV